MEQDPCAPARRGLAAGERQPGALRQQIDTAELKVGARLATEAEMVQRFNVSRTVVREALSKLQAAGLVEPRHGIGTFVCETPAKGLFQLDPADVAGSIDALAVLELRISLETESAGLAASRCDKTQIAAMRRALNDFERNLGEANGTISPVSGSLNSPLLPARPQKTVSSVTGISMRTFFSSKVRTYPGGQGGCRAQGTQGRVPPGRSD